MPLMITGPFKASSVLSLHEVAAPDLPEFANLKARRLPSARKLDSLKGPGIYGVFCRDRLNYIGIYTGRANKTFAGNVLDRWDMHITFHSLRSPEISFVPANMLRILHELEGDPSETFAKMLGGRGLSLEELSNVEAPFISRKPSCTFNKALFATRNWDVYAPGDNDRILSEVTFVYGRVDDASAELLDGAEQREAYHWAKYNWLEQRETALVKALRPICNSVTDDYREDVTSSEFIAALSAQFDRPLDRFVAKPHAVVPSASMHGGLPLASL